MSFSMGFISAISHILDTKTYYRESTPRQDSPWSLVHPIDMFNQWRHQRTAEAHYLRNM
jgi:hypothetical protein